MVVERPKNFTPQDDSEVARSVKEHPKISAVANAKELEEAGIAKVHPQTVRNFLVSPNFRA